MRIIVEKDLAIAVGIVSISRLTGDVRVRSENYETAIRCHVAHLSSESWAHKRSDLDDKWIGRRALPQRQWQVGGALDRADRGSAAASRA